MKTIDLEIGERSRAAVGFDTWKDCGDGDSKDCFVRWYTDGEMVSPAVTLDKNQARAIVSLLTNHFGLANKR